MDTIEDKSMTKSSNSGKHKQTKAHKPVKQSQRYNDRKSRRPDMKFYVPPKAKTDNSSGDDKTVDRDESSEEMMCQNINSLIDLQISDSSLESNVTHTTHPLLVNNTQNESFDTKESNENNTTKKEEEEEDNSWDTMFDDNGDCVDQQFADKVSDLICNKKVDLKLEKSRIDYLNFESKEPEIGDTELPHVLEVYDFASEVKTQDIITSISIFNSRDFDIKWVDDTHALAVFSNGRTATEALKFSYPNIKLRPLSQAIKESKLKARNSSEFLQPYKQRPQTSASLARRLVTQSLGLRDRITPEQRARERKQLADAKEKKKLAVKQNIDVWEGNVL
ncbi:coiled-coil domain-containing protein R3HCC1L-like [Oppia nitens]|uniref:coiled-coil domain-containing protein R3HCC1L-like n=1 Tax=Oppia nitens TaxID=1686743 RepID=UPI0023DCBFBB|nr:coiled-coil domain-containing protein R3HCC1L-like [Oppia nitens]